MTSCAPRNGVQDNSKPSVSIPAQVCVNMVTFLPNRKSISRLAERNSRILSELSCARLSV